MAKSEEFAGDIGVVDNLTAPTILVSGVRGAMQHDGIVTINFSNPFLRAPGGDIEGPYDAVVARLAMSQAGFLKITQFFVDHRQRMIDDGSIVVEEVKVGAE